MGRIIYIIFVILFIIWAMGYSMYNGGTVIKCSDGSILTLNYDVKDLTVDGFKPNIFYPCWILGEDGNESR
jgi:hypothetical protein